MRILIRGGKAAFFIYFFFISSSGSFICATMSPEIHGMKRKDRLGLDSARRVAVHHLNHSDSKWKLLLAPQPSKLPRNSCSYGSGCITPRELRAVSWTDPLWVQCHRKYACTVQDQKTAGLSFCKIEIKRPNAGGDHSFGLIKLNTHT